MYTSTDMVVNNTIVKDKKPPKNIDQYEGIDISKVQFISLGLVKTGIYTSTDMIVNNKVRMQKPRKKITSMKVLLKKIKSFFNLIIMTVL